MWSCKLKTLENRNSFGLSLEIYHFKDAKIQTATDKTKVQRHSRCLNVFFLKGRSLSAKLLCNPGINQKNTKNHKNLQRFQKKTLKPLKLTKFPPKKTKDNPKRPSWIGPPGAVATPSLAPCSRRARTPRAATQWRRRFGRSCHERLGRSLVAVFLKKKF